MTGKVNGTGNTAGEVIRVSGVMLTITVERADAISARSMRLYPGEPATVVVRLGEATVFLKLDGAQRLAEQVQDALESAKATVAAVAQ